MHALHARLSQLLGYVVTLLAVTLLTYTAACAPKPQEQWNSYYYGTTPQMEQGITYYGGKDVDDNYQLPSDMGLVGDGNALQTESILHGNRLR